MHGQVLPLTLNKGCIRVHLIWLHQKQLNSGIKIYSSLKLFGSSNHRTLSTLTWIRKAINSESFFRSKDSMFTLFCTFIRGFFTFWYCMFCWYLTPGFNQWFSDASTMHGVKGTSGFLKCTLTSMFLDCALKYRLVDMLMNYCK